MEINSNLFSRHLLNGMILQAKPSQELEEMKRQRLAREARAARLAQTKAPVVETPAAAVPTEVGPVLGEIEVGGCDGYIFVAYIYIWYSY